MCAPYDFSAEGAEGSARKNLTAAMLPELAVGVTPRSENCRDAGASKSAFGEMALPDDLLLGGTRPNDDRTLGRLIVLGFLAPALALGAFFAPFFDPAFYADFVAMRIPALDSPLNAHLRLLLVIPVRAVFQIPRRIDVVNSVNLLGGLVNDPAAIPLTVVLGIAVALHNISLNYRARPLGEVHVAVIALDDPFPLHHSTPGPVPAILDPVHPGVVLVSGLTLALALNDLALDIGCAVGGGVECGPRSLRDVQTIHAAVHLDDIDVALHALHAVWLHLVPTHRRPLVLLVARGRRVPLPLPHVAGLPVHFGHGGLYVWSHPAA
ncbi:66550187-7ba2-48d2-bffa-5968d35444a3 [Thermothielavioides terrestris]|uniref:66550187-7ba2-48d2-bffa-5968d35444a3 n=1 Tax=Thermothielavioides terrestris TaxID=2587410 RepID=A0A3S4ALT1_9PEZI|nr:66550187-7ba2-48d2-bffa-5968d35444a3 [Thermothielavioides terrestris]